METKPAEPMSREAGISWLVSRIRPRAGRTLVAIAGVDGAGKSTFADDLAADGGGGALREGGGRGECEQQAKRQLRQPDAIRVIHGDDLDEHG